MLNAFPKSMHFHQLKLIKIKSVFSEENYVPQPSSFVGYIENYGIKLLRPFKQQYSMGRNGHSPKWLWAEMVMDRNGYGPK